MDRLLGYGLKYPTGFGHTHPGIIGSARADAHHGLEKRRANHGWGESDSAKPPTNKEASMFHFLPTVLRTILAVALLTWSLPSLASRRALIRCPGGRFVAHDVAPRIS